MSCSRKENQLHDYNIVTGSKSSYSRDSTTVQQLICTKKLAMNSCEVEALRLRKFHYLPLKILLFLLSRQSTKFLGYNIPNFEGHISPLMFHYMRKFGVEKGIGQLMPIIGKIWTPQLKCGFTVEVEVFDIFRMVFTERTSATKLISSSLKIALGEAGLPCH